MKYYYDKNLVNKQKIKLLIKLKIIFIKKI